MPIDRSEPAQEYTISVPEAGWRFDRIKNKDTAYAAARSGLILTIRVGRFLRVPVAAMLRIP